MTDMTDMHCITERADGPDLDDLVRLIRYLREHGRLVAIDQTGALSGNEANSLVRVRWGWPNVKIHSLVEGRALPEAFYVGPDGAVYDCNGDPL